jgi:large-conductance mechanosensitive channel
LPLYLVIAAVLAILALLLTKIISNLNQIAAAREGRHEEAKTIAQILTSKGVVTFLIFAAIIFGAYTTVNKATELGRQEGYAPDQPIKFSHATHAGLSIKSIVNIVMIVPEDPSILLYRVQIHV